jgi:beta-galactosidase
MYGGLYTDANLIVTNAIHQTLPLYRNLQTSGVYVYPSNIDTLNRTATANIESEVYNESSSAQMVTLSVDVYDHGATKVATQTGTAQSIAAGQKAILTVSVPLTAVHFWAPEFPYLYTARSSIAVGGNVVDVADNTLGIRKFSFSPLNGFRINGHPYYLPGFSPREVMDWSGPGIPQDWMTEYDYNLWKEANASFIRPMHVAPRRHMVDSADRMGMIMVVPSGDSEGCPPGQAQPGVDWPQHLAVMQNVMIYFRNDPSVAFYEACNEALSQQQITDMKAVRDKWDPHGGRYMGARDVNPAISYEYGSPMDWAARSTTVPFWAAEYSREESARRVWDKYTPAWDPHTMQYRLGGYINIASPYYSSPASCPGGLEATMGNCICEYPLTDFRTNSMEDQALDNVYNYWQGYSYSSFVEDPATRTKYGIQMGGSKIFFADSDSDGRMHDTEVARVSGVVDGSRLPKSAFYSMKVAASLTPDIAILGHWNYPAGTTKTVYVVASCGTGATTPSTVTLGAYDATGQTLLKSFPGAMAPGGAYPNANSTPGSPSHYVWAFPNVAYQPGVLKAAATCGSTTVTDQKVTAGAPVALKLTPVLGPKGWFADGADIAMVDFEVVDSSGRRVPTDEANVDFTYSGDGVWIGGYNSGVRLSKFKPNLWTEGGINRLFVRSTAKAGTYTITATRTGLTPATITLTSTPFPVDSTGLTQYWSQRYDVTLGTEPTPVADPTN